MQHFTHPTTWLFRFVGLLFTLTLAACGTTSLITSKDKPTHNNLGYYYLPSKLMEGSVTYTVNYLVRHYRDDEHLKKHPNSKRHYTKDGEPTALSVKMADDIALAYRNCEDLSNGYWLTTSNKRGLNEFEVTYAGTGSHVIKTINSAYTPAGPEIMNTSLKVLTSLAPVLRDISLIDEGDRGVMGSSPKKKPKWMSYAPDSSYRIKKQVIVRKVVDVAKFAGDIRTQQGARVMLFNAADLQIGDVTVLTPTVEIWVRAESLTDGQKEFQKNIGEDALTFVTVPTATTPSQTPVLPSGNGPAAPEVTYDAPSGTGAKQIAGVLYRMPMECEVSINVTQGGMTDYSMATLANRVSFPQLGTVAVAQTMFSRKLNAKQITNIEFNTENGGLVKYKRERPNSSNKTIEESGALAKTIAETYIKEREENTPLKQMQNSNAELTEKIKLLENQKKLNELQQGHP